MPAVDPLATALFALVGLILGLMGSGGSILALPLLVYVAEFPAEEAVAASLAVVGATALVGAFLQYQRGAHHFKATFLLGAAGMAGAYWGAELTRLVPQRTLMLIFSTLMLIVGVTMLRRKPDATPGDRCYPLRCAAIGVGVGVLTGFLGVGGGFLIVPALILLAGIGARQAIAASLGIIFLNSAAGLVGHLGEVELDWAGVGAFVAAALAGMWAGVRLADRVPDAALRKGFAWALIGIAAVVGAANVSSSVPAV